MDSLTQAALGAAIGEAFLGKKIGNKGAVIGAVVATIPDLDVALYLFYDKFQMLSIHRGYSHSILFSLLGAFLIAYTLQRIKWTKLVSYNRLWIFSWLALFTHMLLDTFTAYGTQLFLPFSNNRVGFDSINIVDPVYTVPLLVGLLCSLIFLKNKPSRGIYNYLGIAISTLYLLGTLGVKEHVEQHFRTASAQQNIAYNSLLTVPVGIASLSWYGVMKAENGLYLGKYPLLKEEESAFAYFPINEHLLNEIPPVAAETMRWFAKGNYTVTRDQEKIRIYNLQVDMRGIVKEGETKAPTMGYFEITPKADAGFLFSSGAHQQQE
ncbi:MAG: metal-dependent hydrolase [Lewinella sp.]|uniref:metal-dependent hydrolase n=1 Tax=Lewinella sp. TaxID=2004506 RepID=UPI003D6AE680